MKTETLKSLHKRATISAGVVVAVLAVLILVYLVAVEKGALRSISKPLVQKSAPMVASNLPPAKAVTVAVAPSPAPKPAASSPAPEAKPPSPEPPKQVASSPATSKADVPAPKPVATNIATTTPTPARVAPPVTIVTNTTADDENVARRWLADTNQRPAIRVQYRASDILRLTTELNRGLLIAGSGTTNRREFFLQSTSVKSPLFSPFTKSVAQRFADYSLALSSSPTFEPLTAPLPAYFPDADYDLAFVPDRTLATEIFAKVASAFRSLVNKELASSTGVVFEGELQLTGTQPDFVLLEAKLGTNRHVFVTP